MLDYEETELRQLAKKLEIRTEIYESPTGDKFSAYRLIKDEKILCEGNFHKALDFLRKRAKRDRKDSTF